MGAYVLGTALCVFLFSKRRGHQVQKLDSASEVDKTRQEDYIIPASLAD